MRVGTILGETVRTQITDLFEKPLLLVIRGSASPFVFIWDQDVVGSIRHAISADKTGIYNVAGDGALSLFEIATRLGKRCVVLPAWLISTALAALKMFRLTQYGPEQVDFLRYLPVLDNRRLKQEFGYIPARPRPKRSISGGARGIREIETSVILLASTPRKSTEGHVIA